MDDVINRRVDEMIAIGFPELYSNHSRERIYKVIKELQAQQKPSFENIKIYLLEKVFSQAGMPADAF